MDVERLIGWTGVAVDVAGVAVMVAGAAVAMALYARALVSGAPREDAYRRLRENVGRAILLGLELLVAADIIETVAVHPDLNSVAVLGGLVIIRTFLSVALAVELEGTWPWRRAGKRTAPPP